MRAISHIKKTFILALLSCAVIVAILWSNEDMTSFESMTSNKILPWTKMKSRVCSFSMNDDRNYIQNRSDLKMIYYITPTYPRPEQVPELTRLAHTLMHVPRLHWIVADDQSRCSIQVLNILKRTGLPFTHISSPKGFAYKQSRNPRGVANRRAALAWIRKNIQEGVLYFGDDDNSIDLRLFEEIRNTKKVSMFPVGLIGGYGVSSPIVKKGKVVGFFDSWPASRTFPVDMAGFAINIEYLTPNAKMPFIAGHEEDGFLVSLGVSIEEIEPLADNCTKILVWHTRTVKYKKPILKIDVATYDKTYTNFPKLIKETCNQGMADVNPKKGVKTVVTRNRISYNSIADIE